jgi:autotransporter-associated beta strand protein
MNRVLVSVVQQLRLSALLFQAISLVVTGALLLAATSQHEALAITITMEYTDEGSPSPHPENPAWDPVGFYLKRHFERAKQIWEQLLPGPGNYEFDYHWDDDIGTSLGLTTDSALDTFIEINPNQPWFADPTPNDDSEFSFADQFNGAQVTYYQRTYGQLSGIDQTTYFPGSAPPNTLETLYRGFGTGAVGSDSNPPGQPIINDSNGYDLLSTIVHEMGHVLGIYGIEPGEYNIDPQHVGGITDVLVLEGDGGHLGGNRNVPGFLMCDSCGAIGVRRLPTATDILVIAEDQGISDVHLKRIGRITSGAWHIPGAWIGSDVPTGAEDAYISYNQTVTLDQDAAAKNLLVAGGSTLIVGDRIMSSAGVFDFSTATAVTVDAGGIIYANKIVRGGSDLATADGSSVFFNSYEGGASTTATFGGRVGIGTGSGTSVTFDPATIKTWTIANDLSVGEFRSADFIVDNDTTVTSGSGRIGAGSISGTGGVVTVAGANSEWTVNGPVYVAAGSIYLSNYGRLKSAASYVGGESAYGSVSISTYARWDISADLTVGPDMFLGAGTGQVNLQSEGTLAVDGNVTLRGTPTSASQITVSSGGNFEVDGTVNVKPYGIVAYRDTTYAHAGIIGSQEFENLGAADNNTSTGGITRFFDNATAGNAHFANRPGATFFAGGGQTQFYNNSTAGNDNNGHGTFNNYASNSTVYSGATRFFDFASAASATFYNHTTGGFASQATVEFNGDSTGANGTFINLPGVLGQSLGGAFIFKDRSKAGYGTYTSQGEGGTVAFYHNSSADHGTFTTADNIGGNSTINFYDDAKAESATFNMGANTSLNFNVRSQAQHATISVRPAGHVNFAGEYNVAYNGTTSAGDATIELKGATTPYTYGGSAGFSTWSTAGNATITAQGGTVLNAGGGTINFDYVAHAGDATLIANGGSSGGAGGEIYFRRGATGDNAKVVVNAGGLANFGGNISYGGTTVGSIEGAGTFALNGSELRTGGRNTDTTVSGPIIDALGTNPNGQLTKNGTGTLTLAGANTYTGLTTINGGTLSVTGSLMGGAVVNGRGKLNGTGAIAGGVTVNSGGTFDPGLSPGTITVGGLQLNAGSYLRFELGAVRDHIVLTGGGNVSLAGVLDLSLLAGFAPSLNETFPLFEGAVGAIAGTFSAVNSPIFNGHKLNVVYGINSVTLQVIDAVLPPGDYNGNGAVEGADYVVWRRGLGTTYNQTHYNLWRAHFGETAGSGAGASANAAIPEPATWVMLIIGFLAVHTRRRETLS